MENGDEVEPVWPQGFSASFGPLRVFDASGAIVGSEGDRIQAGGNDPYENAAGECGRKLFVNVIEPILKEQ